MHRVIRVEVAAIADHFAARVRSPEDSYKGGWLDTAMAWKEIRDNRGYRKAGYADFDTYSGERWGKDRDQIDNLIRFALVGQAIPEISGIHAPENAAQARELTRVEPERRAEVWQSAVEPYGAQPPAAQIRQTASPRNAETRPGSCVDRPRRAMSSDERCYPEEA